MHGGPGAVRPGPQDDRRHRRLVGRRRRTGFLEHLARAIVAAAAAGRGLRPVLELLKVAHALHLDGMADVTVADAIAEADDHGRTQVRMTECAQHIANANTSQHPSGCWGFGRPLRRPGLRSPRRSASAASWARPPGPPGRSRSPGGRCAPRCRPGSPAGCRARRSRARSRSRPWPP